MKTRMTPQPRLHPRMFVGSVVVDDEVQVELGGSLAIDLLEKADELLMAVTSHAVADHLAVEHAERGEEGGRSVALVVVGSGSEPALLHRQTRLGAVESLNLALLVHAQHQGLVGRIQIEPDN